MAAFVAMSENSFRQQQEEREFVMKQLKYARSTLQQAHDVSDWTQSMMKFKMLDE